MTKLIGIIFLLFSFFSNSYSDDIYKAFAVAIYDENKMGENIQHKTTTQNDYNGICYVKIAIFGKISNNSKIEVNIGNSIGNFQEKIPITNNKNIVIGYEYSFKFYTVTKGHIEVKVDNKLYDSKVFVK
ncbi:hypothetical protein AFAEC_1883 [Aliarcobacter faecis]|uniref:hypothetical protein n=1 Tax=Aliarcobacter faecis TaxID=1564138 RepID=UPI00047E170F|nr:hypothetical protein [Aliarcobacter faecis]QKF74035.1 hypothetical protein AFAEC_1883 [Aliarcobacter faecis]